jgi:multidrug transporter EmrE-like cation transporter
VIAALIVAWGVSMGILGDYFLKTSKGLDLRFLAGFLFYAATALPVSLAYRRAEWMYVALLWSLLALIGCFIVGSLVFREEITWQKLGAFGLALVAIALWNLKP